MLLVGGGEEGVWQRAHPSEPTLGWLMQSFIPLVVDEWNGDDPWWVAAYGLGLLAMLLCWTLLAGAYVFRYQRHRIGQG
jgi:hypothetical protein